MDDAYESLRDVLLQARQVDLDTRASSMEDFWRAAIEQRQSLYFRQIESASGRVCDVKDPFSGEIRSMLMFGSNNYLGLADDPMVAKRTRDYLERSGLGLGGPPLLNGYTRLLRDLEVRLARLKGTEEAIVFPTGYQTNLALLSTLTERGDLVLYDEAHHASFYDGLKLSRAESQPFRHNDMDHLDILLKEHRSAARDAFVFIEGVYSMDGDLAPLEAIVDLCDRYDAWLVLDDAHGTGVMGSLGHGTAEHFGLDDRIDMTMGTFSKTLAAVGGFLAGPANLVAYLRFFARPYMFSAALPPAVLALIHAGLDVLDSEPERVDRLRRNTAYLRDRLRDQGFTLDPDAAIIPLLVPPDMHIRRAAYAFHEAGLFVNAIEWPAVPADQQRFRISLMSEHTEEDLDTLDAGIAAIWADPDLRTIT